MNSHAAPQRTQRNWTRILKYCVNLAESNQLALKRVHSRTSWNYNQMELCLIIAFDAHIFEFPYLFKFGLSFWSATSLWTQQPDRKRGRDGPIQMLAVRRLFRRHSFFSSLFLIKIIISFCIFRWRRVTAIPLDVTIRFVFGVLLRIHWHFLVCRCTT